MTSEINDYSEEKAFQEELQKITDENIKSKLNQIKALVVKRLNLEKEFRSEQSKLEAKYEEEYAPLYLERAEIINGSKKILSEEVKDVLKGVNLPISPEVENGIPDYWLTCLKNSSQFCEMINEKDENILKHLTNINLSFKPNGDFTLIFHFSQNQFFKHETLYRNFILDEKLTIKKIESSKIEWNSEELNPTVAKKKKKLKNKNKPSEVKTIVKVEEVPSFFNFFKDYTAPENHTSHHVHKKSDDDCEEDIDENEFIDEEYELGIFFKDELIPYSLEYYLDLVDEEDDEEEEEDDDDEEDEDDEEAEKKPKKKLF